MEILVAVIALAGAVLAAVAAVALIRRLREEFEGWLVAWTVAAVAVCLSLAVIAIGYVMGFGPTTFKLYQVTGSFLAPFWLAIGLIQLLAEKVPPKFLAWLLGIAVTIVATVVMIFDPLLQADGMSKSLPPGNGHWGLIPDKMLLGIHGLAVVIMLGAVVVAGLRWRNGDEYDTDNLHAVMVIAPSGVALVGAMRFSVPGIFTVALLVVAGAATWYCVLRPLAPYEDDEDDEIASPERDDRASHGRRPPPEHPPERRPRPEPVAMAMEAPPPPQQPPPPQAPQGAGRPRRSGLGDLVAEYRAGDQQIDYASRMAPPPDDGPSTGYIMNGGRAPAPAPVPQTGPQDFGMPPVTGAVYPGAELFGPPGSHTVQARRPQPAPGGGKPAPTIYGLLTVFTIMDGAGDAFDRLAEATVQAVQRGEPDTLVYACHAVKSAPLQRIVYELYRDEVAYRDHQRQPHVERFVNDRQTMVLATNIIELDVNAAKVVPLPTVPY